MAIFGQPAANPNQVQNYSAGPYAPPATNTGIGSVTSGITAGALPQQTLNQASQSMLAPSAFGGHFGGALGNQFGAMMGQQQNQGNSAMLRQAAPQQENLQLQMQQAQANGGLQNAALLSRLQQDNFAAGAPGRNLLFNMLGQYFS